MIYRLSGYMSDQAHFTVNPTSSTLAQKQG